MSADPALAERYGAARPGRRRAVVAGVLVVVLAFLGWLAWAAWAQARPEVNSELLGFEVTGPNTTLARVSVAVEDDVEARCVVRALAEDHGLVGELAFTPERGTNVVEIRTEREATSVTLVGCTAPGQPRPR